ncbi:MAG: Ig-like domain-containing protein, partial [Chitinispirillaceae bacterium]|nr:Ig-like domain-containing protein [Chitinispirillaceae bacterium]
KAIGSAVVTVTTKDGNKTASCEVAVPEIVVLVAGVVLSNTSFTLLPNQTDTLKAIVIPENATNKEISWNSSDTNVVTVNNGSITAKAVGTAQITVTTDDGSKVAHCVVNVSTDIVSVTGVLLSTSSISLFPNQTDTLKVNVLPENASDKKVTWSSADTTIVSVIYGVIAAKRVGKTTVTVTTNDGNKTAEFTVTVVPPNVSVYSVTLNKSLSILFPHGEDTLKATILPWDATNKNLIWTSSHPSIVSVSDGVITAHDTGKVQVSVTTQDGNKIANCQVLVVIPVIEVSSVTLNKTTLSLDRNESEMLIATVLPENATNKSISWGTSDPEIVSVEEGVVTALNPGTARIIALSSNERTSAKCTVTVVEPTIPVTGVSIDRSELSMSVYTTYWLYANILPENATNRNISWKSSDESVVKVNDGKIIAINAGSATIAVTSEDGEHSATCLVSVEHDLGTVNDVEGNEYGTIRIGNLIWTTENIRTTRYNDNTEIALADNTTWSSDTEGAHHISDGRVYYNWHVINTGRLAPVEGGWRVPTIDDWEALAKTLVLFGYNYDGTTDTTQENKIASSLSAQSDWEPSDENPGAPGRDLSANNRSHFNALPDGFRHLNGTFIENNGQRTDWWSSSPAKSATDALLAFLLNNSSKLNLGSMDKRNGFPVRLVKDALEH